MIEAHGATYPTIAAAEARIAELVAANNQPGVGPSDGRVTEINMIREAIQAAQAAAPAAAPKARAAAPVMGPRTAQFVAESESRIRYLSGYKLADDGKWRYLMFQDDRGRKTRREYRTELGFLRAYVRAARGGMDILIAE